MENLLKSNKELAAEISEEVSVPPTDAFILEAEEDLLFQKVL